LERSFYGIVSSKLMGDVAFDAKERAATRPSRGSGDGAPFMAGIVTRHLTRSWTRRQDDPEDR
jgi:hypothetical protein